MNYTKFLNVTSLARKPSAIRILSAIALQAGPSMISLAGGMPNPATFPFKEATFKMWNGNSLHFNEDRMKLALQYSASPGIPAFLEILSELQNFWHSSKHHKPFTSNNLCVTFGSAEGISKSLDMLLNAEDGILIEQPTSPQIIRALKPLGCRLLPVTSDHAGIQASDIHHAFNTFHADNHPEGKIKCLYTSTSLPSTNLQRRREIMQLSKEKDFLILEHDPFFFVSPWETRVPSYLSLDTEGRVLRFDSFSHVFAPGMRLGLVSGNEELVRRVVLHVMVSTMHSPSMNQMIVNELLREMKIEGFNRFCEVLADHYEVRRKLASRAAEENLEEFFDWELLQAGFSLRLKLKDYHKVELSAVMKELEKEKVYFLDGKDCYIEDHVDDELLFSFGSCEEEDITKGCVLLGKAVKKLSH